jgi:YkoY family integral membrane protein
MFGQTFEPHDLAIIALLIVLEGVLSIDNALVLGLLARRLPLHQRKKALTYGLIGAFVFRFIAIATATFLLKWTVFKLLGGAYLVYVAAKYFVFESGEDDEHKPHIELDDKGKPVVVGPKDVEAAAAADASALEARDPVPGASAVSVVSPPGTAATAGGKARAAFWPTVFVIEMTDIAFAVDSIVAAIGIVGQTPPDHPQDASHPKMWVIILGGFLGVVLMRFAAVLFIRLLDRFPRFETAAYLLVLVIGVKLCIDWGGNKFLPSSGGKHAIDFHDPHEVEFWVFWVAMIASFCVGFIPSRKAHHLGGVPGGPKG